MMQTKVAGVNLPMCLMNASGVHCTTFEDLRTLGEAAGCGAIVTKSCTRLSRAGNEEPRYTDLEGGGAIQAMGLPNLGFEEYVKMVPELKKAFPAKPVVMSVAGLCEEDNRIMLAAAEACGPDLIELNLSCPNIVGKPQVGYDFEETDRLLRVYCEGLLTDTRLGLKLPPYFDAVHFDKAAEIINEYSSKIRFVTTINSIGRAMAIDVETETTLIKPKGGMGGLSGPFVKPVGLANVNSFRTRLSEKIDLIGVGGIQTGRDVYEYLLAGAAAVQVGTTLWREGPTCFARVAEEFEQLMQRKGRRTVAEVVGSLRICDGSTFKRTSDEDA